MDRRTLDVERLRRLRRNAEVVETQESLGRAHHRNGAPGASQIEGIGCDPLPITGQAVDGENLDDSLRFGDRIRSNPVGPAVDLAAPAGLRRR